ncbi:MAG: orotate phosphoribosyltransferase [bacterium]|nr:orotate phosphoribosyltransferase [bacterium]
MTIADQVIDLLRTTGALLEGHFLLTSGLHSQAFVQCARLLQYPQHAEALGGWIADCLRDAPIDVVISPAIGGIVIGQEVARALGVRALFGERQEGVMTLRRGLQLAAGERVLVVEDVTTTGGSVREVIGLLEARQAVLVAVGTILDRSTAEINFAVPHHALACLSIETYRPEDCPLCKAGGQPIKPGSRQA